MIPVTQLPYRNHRSYQEITQLESRSQERDPKYYYNPAKPQGLWYGFYDSWLNWQKEQPDGLVDINPDWYLYTVTIEEEKFIDINHRNPAKILRINNLQEYKLFYQRYQISAIELLTGRKTPVNEYEHYINWKQVAVDYAGIEVPKLQKFEMNALFDWDVNSGCIWKVSVIDKFDKFN